jgi:hypothetical protein
VGFDNFAVEGKRRQAWKLGGRASVTTSSGYLAYAARLLTQLSLLHKKATVRDTVEEVKPWAYLTVRLWAARNLSRLPVHSATRLQTGSRDRPAQLLGAIFHSFLSPPFTALLFPEGINSEHGWTFLVLAAIADWLIAWGCIRFVRWLKSRLAMRHGGA